jgi:hypothetical protein
VGSEVCDYVLSILTNGGDPTAINYAHICLVPKVNNQESRTQFRPSSLSNLVFKLVLR